MDTFDDELRSHLAESAASIVAEPAGIDDVKRRGRRRGRRRRAVAVVATVALVGAAAVGIRPLVADDQSTLDIAAGTPAATPEPDSGAGDSTALQEGPAMGTTTTVAPTSFQSESAVSRGGGGSGVDPEWVVPWGDGFLSIDLMWTAIEPPALTPGFIAAFPPEIAAVIEASGETTLQGMFDVLTDAGLATQATEIVMDDPELLAQIQSSMTEQGTPRLVAQQSADGSTWTEVAGFDPPVAADSIGRVVSDGTHLVIQQQTWGQAVAVDGVGTSSINGAGVVSVLVTTDLTNWQTFDITPPVADDPPYVRNEQWISGLAIGPDGWLASVQSSSYLDLWSLLPAGLRETEGGVDYRATPDGIQVDIYPSPEGPIYPVVEGPEFHVAAGEDAGSFTTVPPSLSTTTTAVGAAPTPTVAPSTTTTILAPGEELEFPGPIETRLYTWTELGIDPAVGADLGALRGEPGSETLNWVGTWDGVVRSISKGSGSGYQEPRIVGTDAGFLGVAYDQATGSPTIEFSPDGLSWSSAEQPPGDWFDNLVAVDGGVLINVSGPDGTLMWRGNPDGTGWAEVDIPGIGNALRSFFGQRNAGPGFVSVVDVSEPVDRSEPAVEFDVGIEQDGQSIHLYAHDDGTADLIITDLDTGEIVADINGAYGGLDADFVEIGSDSITIIDNDGNEVASIPLQVVMDTVLPARDEAIRASGWEPPPPQPPELMIVASADGLQWLVTPFEARGPAAQFEAYPSAMVINGLTVAVRTGGMWQTFRIG